LSAATTTSRSPAVIVSSTGSLTVPAGRGDAQFGSAATPARPALIARRVGHDAQEPRPKATLRVDRRERSPGSLAGHLDDVVGVGTIAEDHRGDTERAVTMTGDQRAEGLGITTLGLPEKSRFIVLDGPVLVDRLGVHRASR
jgi:hypothetical protein